MSCSKIYTIVITGNAMEVVDLETAAWKLSGMEDSLSTY